MSHEVLQNAKIRILFHPKKQYSEEIAVNSGKSWIPTLSSFPHATLPSDHHYAAEYALENTQAAVEIQNGVATVRLDHPDHLVTRTIRLSESADAVDFTTTFRAKKPMRLRAVEDKWSFLAERRDQDNDLSGPLDFVWSQRIKSFPTSFVSHYSFRTPIVMMQQGTLFTGLIPGLETVDSDTLLRSPLGLDLNVTDARHPWMSYGAIVGNALTPDNPCEAGHSQIVRGISDSFCQIDLGAGEEISYSYTMIVSHQPQNLGYRYAVRYLWNRYGAPAIANGKYFPHNARYPGVETLKQWEDAIWARKAENEFFTFQKNGVEVGGLIGSRQGDWFSRTDYRHDAWFGCWLQELISGYGMYLYGQTSGAAGWLERSEQILNLILSAPRSGGMFPIICYYESDGTETWLKDDGWAGFKDEYHSLQMSWTAYLMLQWGRSLFPGRMGDIMEFCLPYAQFLTARQHRDGCIPSWFDDNGEPVRKQFRDFNAETATSALFLMEIGELSGDTSLLDAGYKALDFITAKVLPRQRWFDLETFLSCARKPFNFYDSISTQFPQCNLSQMHATMAYLKKHSISKKPGDLLAAEKMMDYLLLTQQLWDHPLLHINSFGGFTVQNTDNEWSDVREGICGILLHQFFEATGKREYLERSIAAVHAGFEVLPYENWAHCGYEGMQYDSSLLWGGGVIVTSAQYLEQKLGTLAILADEDYGIGVDGCRVHSVSVAGDRVVITADFIDAQKGVPLSMRIFSKTKTVLTVVLNGVTIGVFSPVALEAKLTFTI